jgi:transposase
VGKSKPPYPPEVRAGVVKLVRDEGVSLKEAADTIGCTVESVRDWVRKAQRDDGELRDGGLTTDERTELNQLRRRVRVLEQEKEILRKAAAWFAKETHSTP